MVAIGISEFSFGYAFLHEQTLAHWNNLTAAPILPSLQQEANVGWDAHLPLEGEAFFYQFKLSEYLFRSNARFIDNGTYNSPYYRVTLHRRENNRQHRLLRAHFHNNPNTFYVAPELQTVPAFNTAFLAHVLGAHTRLFSLGDCEDIAPNDGSEHCITFQPGEVAWDFHSERVRKERSFFGSKLEDLYIERTREPRPINTAFARDLLERATSSAREFGVDDAENIAVGSRRLLEAPAATVNRRELLQRVADLSATVFGLTMVIVGTQN
jgi:hypothetical protein